MQDSIEGIWKQEYSRCIDHSHARGENCSDGVLAVASAGRTILRA